MGQHLGNCAADMTEFQRRLREETSLLMQWFQEGRFAETSDSYTVGLELETWLVDNQFQPLAENQKFLEAIDDPMLVPELSKFNAEMNAAPMIAGPGCLHRLSQELQISWRHIQETMQGLQGHMLMIGTLPTLRDSMLTLNHLSDAPRYHALNEHVLRLRRGQPLKLEINGHEHIKTVHRDVMLEAAATSFQVHIKPPFELITQTFNATILASAASVAIAANSPYLFGADLWDETRITVFEQAVDLPGFNRLDGSRQQRVTFGSDFVQASLLELFLENTHSYPVLLPLVESQKQVEDLHHLNLQNGTIWRWNRPVIGFDADGQIHLRVEHRVMSAGPTIDDMVANLAFILGLCQNLAHEIPDASQLISFAQARDNFYQAARYGLQAEVYWGQAQTLPLHQLIREELLPRARRGLEALGISAEEIRYYIDHILEPRISSQQTGAGWQRAWVAQHGRDFQGLTAAYFTNQQSGDPVYSWKI